VHRAASVDLGARQRGEGPLRVGIVGAGRRRQGLGPFLAAACEAAGARVTAVAGRARASTEAAASDLAAQLGHPVEAAVDLRALARGVDALVIAAPVEAHAECLAEALAAGVPCLCEKPLLPADRPAERLAEAAALVAAFRARGLLLDENCQWPFVLPAFLALHPRPAGAPVRELVMGLSPIGTGASMVEDSLSHVLSLLQGLVPGGRLGGVDAVHLADRSTAATANALRFRVATELGPVAVALHLQHCPAPPRPAWFAVDGARVDRRIGAGYTQWFVAPDGREILAADPLHALVYRFAALCRAPDPDRHRELADVLDARLRCFHHVLGALDPQARRGREA
jgi:hypothetical protein